MRAAVDSFESHSDGYISQEFLENDVEEGLDEVEKKTIELTADANGIIESVQDIVDVEKIDETEVVETVHRGKRRVKEVVEELHDLDRSQVASLDSVKEDLQTMKSFLSDMESKFKSGELSVGNYSMKAIRDIDAYQSIKESVDGEEGLIDDSLELILEKMQHGRALTFDEQEELYDYFQDVVLDDKKRKEIKEISSFMNENDIEKLTERLNYEVLATEDSLNKEIAIVEAYLYNGNRSPREHNVRAEDIAKLKIYLETLNNYKIAIAEVKNEPDVEFGGQGDPLSARIEYLDYKETDIPYAISFKTDITISIIQYENDWDREGFLEMEKPLLVRKNESEINYFKGSGAAKHLQHLEMKKLNKEYDNFTSDFIGEEIMGFAFGKLIDKYPSVKGVEAIGRYGVEKNEMERKLTIEEAKTASMDLKMELIFLERYVPHGSLNNLEVQLQPTNTTYNILERWKEVKILNSNIPYPEAEINRQDWYKVGSKLTNNEAEFGRINKDLFDYIVDNELNGNKAVEDIVGN